MTVAAAQVELLFLGTGTSAGVPMIGCHCPVCSSADSRDRRMRASVVISYNDKRILVDTTPELRLQCVANKVDRIDAIIFTHAHADHVMGLDDARLFNRIKGGPLDVWMDDPTYTAISRCFSYAFTEPQAREFRPHLVHRRIDGPFDVEGMTWVPISLDHGGERVLGFRVGNLAYCTDVSSIPDASFAHLNNLDVLVLDALHYRRHEKHFSLEEAVQMATRIGARQTLFTHISHGMAHVEANRLLPPNMQLAFDGQIVRAS